MTVDYSRELEKGRGIDIFLRLLWLWKGSLYKLVWMDLLFYMAIYYLINFIYRFALDKYQRKVFVKMVQFADEMKGNIPFFFLLGFFVSGVIGRWIKMYLLIPWLHRQAFIFQGSINGNEPMMSLRLRRTLLRYLNLAWILQMRQISDQISLRFRNNNIDKSTNSVETSIRDIFINFNRDPKIQNTYGKIITDAEIRTFEAIAIKSDLKSKSGYIPEYWIPIQWGSRIIQKAFLHNYISDPRTVNKMIEELDRVRNNMQKLQIFCGIMIPLVYTQVVIIAVYSFFLCELFASQFIDPREEVKGHELDFYIPIFTIFQFLFLMGWLKVAMCVMNPFGDDDEDFQTSDMLDNNLDSTYRSVSGELDMYPERLNPPKMEYECLYKTDPDNLEQFLDEIDYDLEDIDGNSDINEVKTLELKENIPEKLKNHFKKFFQSRKRLIALASNTKSSLEKVPSLSPPLQGSRSSLANIHDEKRSNTFV